MNAYYTTARPLSYSNYTVKEPNCYFRQTFTVLLLELHPEGSTPFRRNWLCYYGDAVITTSLRNQFVSNNHYPSIMIAYRISRTIIPVYNITSYKIEHRSLLMSLFFAIKCYASQIVLLSNLLTSARTIFSSFFFSYVTITWIWTHLHIIFSSGQLCPFNCLREFCAIRLPLVYRLETQWWLLFCCLSLK